MRLYIIFAISLGLVFSACGNSTETAPSRRHSHFTRSIGTSSGKDEARTKTKSLILVPYRPRSAQKKTDAEEVGTSHITCNSDDDSLDASPTELKNADGPDYGGLDDLSFYLTEQETEPLYRDLRYKQEKSNKTIIERRSSKKRKISSRKHK